MTTSFSEPLKPGTIGQGARGIEEQDGDVAGWSVVAAEVRDEAPGAVFCRAEDRGVDGGGARRSWERDRFRSQETSEGGRSAVVT